MKKLLLYIAFLFCCSCPSVWAAKHTAERLFYTTEFDSLFMEGLCYLHADSLPMAQERFEGCAKLQPKSAAVAYQLSNLYAIQQDTISSIDQLEKAIKHNPNNYFYHTALAEIYTSQENFEEAAKIYKELTKRFSDKDYPLYMLSRCYYHVGDYKKSIQTYNKLEERIGINPDIALEKIYIIALTNDLDAVSEEFAKLHQKFPFNDELYFREGAVYHSVFGQTEKAIACYEKALEINPEHADALRYACDLYDRSGNREKADATMLKIFGAKSIEWDEKRDLLRAALSFYKSRTNYESIIKTIFQKMILADNNNEEIWATYNEFLVGIGDTQAAMEAIETCISILPTCQICHIQRYDLAKTLLPEAEAEQLLDKTLQVLPNDPYFLCNKAIHRYLEHDTTWVSYAEKSIENLNDSTNAVVANYAYSMIGNMYGESNLIEKAVWCTEKSYLLNPSDVTTANNYAYYLALLKRDLDKAAKISYGVIQKEPINSSYLHTYAYILMQQGQLTHAKFYMHQALEYDKEETFEIYNDYAKLLEQLGEKEEAQKMFQMAKEIQQNHEKQTP